MTSIRSLSPWHPKGYWLAPKHSDGFFSRSSICEIYFKNKTARRIEPCTSRAEPVRARDGRAMSTFDSLSSLCRCRLIHSVFQFWPGYLNKTSCPELFFLRSRCDGSASAEGKNAQEAARTSSSGAGHPSFWVRRTFTFRSQHFSFF